MDFSELAFPIDAKLEIKLSSLPVLKFHKSKRTSHFTHKKIFANPSIFPKIVSVLRNIISLYLILTRINVKLVVIMGGII